MGKAEPPNSAGRQRAEYDWSGPEGASFLTSSRQTAEQSNVPITYRAYEDPQHVPRFSYHGRPGDLEDSQGSPTEHHAGKKRRRTKKRRNVNPTMPLDDGRDEMMNRQREPEFGSVIGRDSASPEIPEVGSVSRQDSQPPMIPREADNIPNIQHIYLSTLQLIVDSFTINPRMSPTLRSKVIDAVDAKLLDDDVEDRERLQEMRDKLADIYLGVSNETNR